MTTWNSRVFVCLKFRPVSWWPVETLIPPSTLGRAGGELGGRQLQPFQHGTRLALKSPGQPRCSHRPKFAPCRETALSLLPDCFLLWESRWRPPLPGKPFTQAVGTFERQTATGRLWRQEGTFSSLQAPARTLVLSAVQAVSKLSPMLIWMW